MKTKVREMMTETSSLAVVDENSTLFEAILTIGAVKDRNPGGFRCPGALVADEEHTIIGFLDFRKLLKSLEPRYVDVADSMKEGGISPAWVRSELKKYGLWADALDEICKKVGETVIRDLVSAPEEDQITDVNASLNEALFQMVVSGHDYLFVKDKEALAGVISLNDIVIHICDAVKGCRL